MRAREWSGSDARTSFPAMDSLPDEQFAPVANWTPLFVQRDGADIVLTSLEGEQMPCHRTIVNLASVVLALTGRPLAGDATTEQEPPAKSIRLHTMPTSVLHLLLQFIYGVPLGFAQQPVSLLASLRDAALEYRMPDLVDQCNAAVRGLEDSQRLIEAWTELNGRNAAADWQTWLCWKLVQCCGGVSQTAQHHKTLLLTRPDLALSIMQSSVEEPVVTAGTAEERTPVRKTLEQLFEEPHAKDFEFRNVSLSLLCSVTQFAFDVVDLARRVCRFIAVCSQRSCLDAWPATQCAERMPRGSCSWRDQRTSSLLPSCSVYTSIAGGPSTLYLL